MPYLPAIIALSTVNVVVTYAYNGIIFERTYGCVGELARTGYWLMIIIVLYITLLFFAYPSNMSAA
jgi:hypothetical protein